MQVGRESCEELQVVVAIPVELCVPMWGGVCGGNGGRRPRCNPVSVLLDGLCGCRFIDDELDLTMSLLLLGLGCDCVNAREDSVEVDSSSDKYVVSFRVWKLQTTDRIYE